MITSDFRKKMADSWFSYLQSQICKEFEYIEKNNSKFSKRNWSKEKNIYTVNFSTEISLNYKKLDFESRFNAMENILNRNGFDGIKNLAIHYWKLVKGITKIQLKTQ